MFKSKSIIAFAAILSTAAAAHAAPEAGAPHMTVRYGDLNLSTKSGVVALYERMDAASRAACAPYGEGNSLADRQINKTCREDLYSRGVAQVQSLALEAIAANPPSRIQVASH